MHLFLYTTCFCVGCFFLPFIKISCVSRCFVQTGILPVCHCSLRFLCIYGPSLYYFGLFACLVCFPLICHYILRAFVFVPLDKYCCLLMLAFRPKSLICGLSSSYCDNGSLPFDRKSLGKWLIADIDTALLNFYSIQYSYHTCSHLQRGSASEITMQDNWLNDVFV